MRPRKDRLIGFRITQVGFDDIRAAASQMSIHTGERVTISALARTALLAWVKGVERTAREGGAR